VPVAGSSDVSDEPILALGSLNCQLGLQPTYSGGFRGQLCALAQRQTLAYFPLQTGSSGKQQAGRICGED